MPIAIRTRIEIGHDSFIIHGPQIDSKVIVRMTCNYRGDGGPARFLFNGTRIDATFQNIRRHDERGLTTLGKNGLEVRQVEHILSALLGMNALSTDVELAFPSGKRSNKIAPPVAHLNAEDFAAAIRRAFHIRDTANRLEIGRPLTVKERNPRDRRDPSFAIFAPLNRFIVTAHINFPYFWGKQSYSCSLTPRTYQRDIAWARSFFATPYPHKNEWRTLQRRYPALLEEPLHHARSIVLDYSQQRWLTPLHEDDEPVRHKILDFMGDFALLGVPIQAGVFVYKPYHRFNRQCVVELAKKLLGKTIRRL